MPVAASLRKDLIIAQDYVTHGLRRRAKELATLELGPKTDLELRDKLGAEIAAERFACIDRVMIVNRRRSLTPHWSIFHAETHHDRGGARCRSGCSPFALRRVRCAPISTAR